MAKSMKIEETIKNLKEIVSNPFTTIVRFKNGLTFKTKYGKIVQVLPRFVKEANGNNRDLLKEFFQKPEEDLVKINSNVLHLNQMQYKRTVSFHNGNLIKINKNDAVCECNNEKAFHFVVGRPTSLVIKEFREKWLVF
jgi:hypothetical protein